jgi:hypothetical protein
MAVALILASAIAAPPKIIGVLAGAAVVMLGIIMVVGAERLTRAFNAAYRELPGKFHYPHWYIRASGIFAVVFGVVVIVGQLVFAK